MSEDAFDKEATSLYERVVKMTDDLKEHCDSVIIICTMAEGKNSQLVSHYRGNYYAILGSNQRFSEMLEEERLSPDASASE